MGDSQITCIESCLKKDDQLEYTECLAKCGELQQKLEEVVKENKPKDKHPKKADQSIFSFDGAKQFPILQINHGRKKVQKIDRFAPKPSPNK